MKTLIANGKIPLATHYNEDRSVMWTAKDKLLLGLSLSEYLAQAFRNPLNWLFALIFTVGGYVTITRFVFGLGYVTHSSYDYPWGLFLGQEGGQYPNTLGDLAGRNLISLDRPLELPGAVVNVFG